MKATYRFENDTGIFVCFNNFQDESLFNEFIDFIKSKLGINSIDIRQSPYSITGEFIFKNHELTAMYHEDTGCSIRVEIADGSLADEIIKTCYP